MGLNFSGDQKIEVVIVTGTKKLVGSENGQTIRAFGGYTFLVATFFFTERNSVTTEYFSFSMILPLKMPLPKIFFTENFSAGCNSSLECI